MTALDDPFLAEAIADLVDRRIDDTLRLKAVSQEIGLVESVDVTGETAVVNVKGRPDPQIAIGDRVPEVGDRVLVKKSADTGLRYIAAIFGRAIDESGGGGGGSGGSPNLDGGGPSTIYGGTTPIDGGTP